jgi:NDP-sugar pyrophosphorylase family protein
MKTSAMIFAAGLGTRLLPLTLTKPKALVEYEGKPLLQHVVEKIIAADIRHIVVNVHHFSDQIIHFFNNHPFEAQIDISDESHNLLETGGGFKNAEHFLKNSDRILLYNVDVLSSIDIKKMLEYHHQQGALATLAVQNRKTSRYFIFDTQTLQLCGWCNQQTGASIEARPCVESKLLAFSGIHVVETRIFSLLPSVTRQSFTPIYLDLAKTEPIIGYEHSQDQWRDMGKQ